MIITSVSNFKGSIALLNVGDSSLVPNGDQLTNGNKLSDFIKELEPDVLIKCLGYSLYKEFTNQFEDNAIKESAEQKWKDLLNGKEYQINGVSYWWRGLKFIEGGLETSIPAYYIFTEFIKRDYYGTGVQSEQTKEEKTNPSLVYREAWNKFCDLTIYGGNGLSSLYQFIYDMNLISPGTYQNWKGEIFNKINRFSI